MSEFSWAMLGPAVPEIFLALSGMVFLVAGVFLGDKGTRTLCRAVMASFVVAGLFLFGLSWESKTILHGMFVLDQFAGFMKILVLFGLTAVTAMTVRYLHLEQMARFEYPILVLFAGLGMMMMISAGSLLSMYIGLELQSLSLYVLAAIRRDYMKSSEAGIKYFVLGALSSGMLLFGISLIYGYTGAIGFGDIARILGSMDSHGAGIVIGLVFVLVGLAFKVSAVPFHMWTPDVYEGAPTSVTALFAVVPKLAAMALMIRLLFGPFAVIAPEWQQVVWVISLGSMVLGAFAGLAQNNIKRLMAYSSIGNMGYALIGIVAGTEAGVASVLVYLTIYMVMTAGVFGVILAMRRGGVAVEGIDDLSGLSRSSPLLAYAMAFLMFSMSGIPPLAGFFGKLFVFQAAVASGFYVLAVLGILASVVAAYYYLKIIKVMFFDDPVDAFDREISFAMRAVIAVSIIFVTFFIVSPNTVVESSREAAAVLFAG